MSRLLREVVEKVDIALGLQSLIGSRGVNNPSGMRLGRMCRCLGRAEEEILVVLCL